ncbi:MAG: flippase-like domain-containing protein [Cyclobacteriaceae bacterium]
MTLAQISDNKESFKTKLSWLLKIAMSAAVLWFIANHADLENVTWQKVEPWLDRPMIMFLVIILMPINWLLEAWRWKLAMVKEDLTFTDACKQVFAGLALNWVVPLTLGDASSRLVGVKNYKTSAGALVKVRVIMLIITMIFGGVSMLYYFNSLDTWLLVGLLPILSLGVLWAYKRAQTQSLDLRVVLISLVRYAVFTFQFVIIMSVFLPDIKWVILTLGVGWTFFFRSIIPSLFGNFGVREASALVFFEPLVFDPNLVLIPCLLIWLINTVLPSILGVFFISSLKFKATK